VSREPFDLVIAGGRVVGPGASTDLTVAIKGERIAALLPPGAQYTSARVIHGNGCLVLPGAVDPHTHYTLGFAGVYAEAPEYSIAAAWGGTTTIIDFAVQVAPNGLDESIREKRSEIDGRMGVDYGLHAIVTGDVGFDVMDEIGDVIRNGIPTIKTFMTYELMVDDGHRLGVMERVAEHGGMSVVHAEDDSISRWLTKKYLAEGKTHGGYIVEVRPPFVEEAAVRRAILLARHAQSPLYVLHVAAGSAASAIREARSHGLPIYGETLIAYLSFTQERLWDDEHQGLLWNNIPPIKYEDDRLQLWESIKTDRGLQVVSTDQFAATIAERYGMEGTTIDSLQAGQAAVEVRVPVLYHLGVAAGVISENRFVQLLSTNPAKLMGLYPRKGEIAVGADADIVIFDPRKSWTVDHRALHMASDFNCWDGWQLSGSVRTTILRGHVLIEDGTFVGSASHGQYVPRRIAHSWDAPADLGEAFGRTVPPEESPETADL
jgi:dihydropyrimidinase